MKSVFELAMSLILCIADSLMVSYFYNTMFKIRFGRLRCFVHIILTAFTLFFINSCGNSMLNFVAIPLVFIIFSKMTFQISLRKGIIYTLIYYIAFGCGREIAFEMLYRLIIALNPQLSTKLFSSGGMSFLVFEYALSCLFLLLMGKYTRRIAIAEDSKSDLYLLIMPVSYIMILFSFVFIDFPADRSIQIMMCGGAFLLYFSNVVIFIILSHFTEAMNKAKVAEMSLLKRGMEKNNFENIEKANTVYRKYIHDVEQYFRQFRSLAAAGENKSIISIIDGWEDGLKKQEKRYIYTQSPVLNSILTEHCTRAREKKIDLDIFIEDNLKVNFMQDADMISMFGNLLENAVEAAEKCKENNRKISIKMFMGSRYILVFQIKNTWLKELKKEGEYLLSTKKDQQNHGLGVGIAQELAKKYGGTVELEEDGDWFVTNLMISCCVKV